MPLAVVGTVPHYTVALCLEKAWAVCIACEACDRPPTRWCEAELRRLPGQATLAQIADRARCAGCGAQSGRLFTRQASWGSRAGLARE